MKTTTRFGAVGYTLLVVLFTASLNTAWGAVIYTSESSFQSALAANNYFDNFNGVAGGTHSSIGINGGQDSGAQPFVGTIAASSGNLLAFTGLGGVGDIAVSTADGQPRDIVMTLTSGNVTAIGMSAYLTDFSGFQVGGTVTITLSDSTVESFSVLGSGPADFRGFTTTPGTWITQATLSPGTPDTYMTIDNLYVGAVPEPSTWIAIAFLGVLGVGSFGRKLYTRIR